MKYKAKKLLAFLMTLIMVLQMAPVSAFANGEGGGTDFVSVTISGLNGLTITDDYYVVVGNYGGEEPFVATSLNSVNYADQNQTTKVIMFNEHDDPYVILRKSNNPLTDTDHDIIVRNPGGNISVNATIDEHTVSMKESGNNYTISIAQGYQSEIRFYSIDTSVMSVSNDEKRVDQNGTAILTQPSLTRSYYLLAKITNNNKNL